MGNVYLRRLTNALQVVLRAALAAALSVLLARLCRFEHPVYALITAVVVTDLSPSRRGKLGLQRLIATVVGAVCGAEVSAELHSTAWAIGTGIFVSTGICHLLCISDGAKIAGFTCAIVMLTQGTDPWSCAFFRSLEILLGIGVAWLLSCVPRLIHMDEPAGQDSVLQVKSIREGQRVVLRL